MNQWVQSICFILSEIDKNQIRKSKCVFVVVVVVVVVVSGWKTRESVDG